MLAPVAVDCIVSFLANVNGFSYPASLSVGFSGGDCCLIEVDDMVCLACVVCQGRRIVDRVSGNLALGPREGHVFDSLHCSLVL